MTETQSIPFRTAADESPVSAPTQNDGSQKSQTAQSAGADTSDAPPSLYQTLEKKPYAVKFLGLDLYNDDDDFKEIQEQARDLDKYVLQQIKARGLKDESGSYKEVIDAIYKQIGRSANEDPTQSVKRLSVAAKAISRLESAKLPPVLSTKSLSASEYEEILP